MRAEILFIATLFFSFHVASASGTCFVELTRIFGIGSRNGYALLCKCEATIAKSIVFTSAPPKAMDTVGRNQAAVECIQRKQTRLTRMCNHLNATEFARHTQPVLNRCVNRTTLSEQQAQLTQPFSFDMQNCTSKFASSQNALETAAAWVCECPQSDLYEVTPGWSRYIIRGGADVAADLEKIQSCALEFSDQMQQVCTSNAGDYDVLALQILQTCCKRARGDSERKLECAAVVPEDLTEVKFELQSQQN